MKSNVAPWWWQFSTLKERRELYKVFTGNRWKRERMDAEVERKIELEKRVKEYLKKLIPSNPPRKDWKPSPPPLFKQRRNT